MKILIKEDLSRGIYTVDVPIYNRGLDDAGNGILGIDFDNSAKQIQFIDITPMGASHIIKELEALKKDWKNKSDE